MRAPSARPGRSWIGQRLGPRRDLRAAAHGAGGLRQTAGAAAVRTRLRKHHMAARGLDDARAVALEAPALRRLQPSRALAGAAMILPRDGEVTLPAPHRILERQRQDLVEVDPTLRRPGVERLAPLAEDVCEEVAEGRRRIAAHTHRKIEPLEAKRQHPATRPTRRSRRIAAADRDRRASRTLRRSAGTAPPPADPGVDVWVIPPGEPLVRTLDIVQRRAAFDAQENVKIHTGNFRVEDCRIEDLVGSSTFAQSSNLNLKSAISLYDLPSSTTSASMTSPPAARPPSAAVPPLAPLPAAASSPVFGLVAAAA